MMESGAPTCHTCGELIGVNANGEFFVGCHDCNFPICKACFEYGQRSLRCVVCYDAWKIRQYLTPNSKDTAVLLALCGFKGFL